MSRTGQAKPATTAAPGRYATHRLRPLLTPASIALVGASPRPGSVGNDTARALLASGFAGAIDFVSARHTSVEGKSCVGSLRELSAPPELAILNVGAARLEETLAEAITVGAKAAVVFDACHGVARSGAPLLGRLRDMAAEAAMPVCGGNAMGFFNVPERCHASFYTASALQPGGISLIAHSGSVFTVLALSDPRYRFDLVISPGQEMGATIDEYVDFAAARPSTRVIALFMETARDPRGFADALAQARSQGTPVVVCKVGRTQESASLAISHTGAMAGRDVAYDALFERCGALRVDTVDQLMNVSMLLAQGRAMGPGEVAAVTDSGGLRELLIDRAHTLGVPLARLSASTEASLREFLPASLPASNPLDCAGAISEQFGSVFERGFSSLAAAPETALIGFEADLRDDHLYSPSLAEIAHRLPTLTDKPCFVYSCFSRARNRELAATLADAGVPVLNGLDETLSAVAALRRLRDMRARAGDIGPCPAAPAPSIVSRWRAALAPGRWFGEAAGLAMLVDFGVPVVTCARCECWDEVRQAADTLGYPVVLKTARPWIAHKTEAGGVRANIGSSQSLQAAYHDMATRLGPAVLVQAMAAPGVELAFGYVRDPDFGPLVMVSAGGTLIEILDDRRFALAPFGVAEAERLVRQLALAPLLDGVRGAPPCDTQALAGALARFSVMCATLGSHMEEVDVNPVIVTAAGVTAVDALVGTGKDPR